MKTRFHLKKLFLLATLFLAVWAAMASEAVLTPAMQGQWEGNARIIVNWCSQPRLHVVLEIHPDGSVMGRVGDATLLDGRIQGNRGRLGRKLNLATDYIIKGRLSGPVVAAEDIRREGVSIPLDFTAGGFAGGIHTSGSKLAGKERWILSASRLALRRVR